MKSRLAIFLIFLNLHLVFSDITLPAVISDGMVLQSDAVVPIWGWGKSGDGVSVSFDNQVIKGTVDKSGRWRVDFKPLQPSSVERDMTIMVGNQKKVLHDVVVGEVWLAAGQSNMQVHLDESSRKTIDPKDQPIANAIKRELTQHFDPLIRQIRVPTATSYDQEKENFIGNWAKADSHRNKIPFSSVAYYYAKELRAKLKVPVGVIVTAWGAKKIQPFIPATQYKKSPSFAKYYQDEMDKMKSNIATYNHVEEEKKYKTILAKWELKVKQAQDQGKKPPKQPQQNFPQDNPNFPGTIYNAMINPLVPYAIRGAIWYQGESNAKYLKANVFGYDQYLEQLIDGLRERWGQGEFPFYYCQLAQFRDPSEQPVDHDDWVTICNDMRKALTLNNVGMAVLNDCGEIRDIHPRNKVDPGKRLALWALAKTYGQSDLVFSGPLYKSYTIQKNKVNITFDHTGDGLMIARKHLLNPAKPVDEELQGFQIRSADGAWKWAKAKITSNSSIEVWHPEVSQPEEVRYAWATNPERANLYNKAGLPTSVFSTKSP